MRIADSRNFTVSTTVAAALVTVRPGGLREMHWHPNADEWQYWIKGKGQMTVFNTGPNAVTMDFNAGDVGYVKKNLGHYIKNTGDTDLQFLEVFRVPYFADVSLSDWISRTPPSMVAQHLTVSEATIAKFPKNKPEVMPERSDHGCMRPKATCCPLRLGPADCPDIRFAGRVSSIRPAVLSEGALSSIGGRKSSRAHPHEK